jgi:hypothetical protein
MGSADPIPSTAFRCIESLVSCLEHVDRGIAVRHRSDPTTEGDLDVDTVEDEVVGLADPAKIVTAPGGVLVRRFWEDETQLFPAVTRKALLAPRPDSYDGCDSRSTKSPAR